MSVWEELKKFAAAGENWIEGVEEHVAVLMARKLDHDRRVALEAQIAAMDPATVDEPTQPPAVAPVVTPAATPGTDANGSPVA